MLAVAYCRSGYVLLLVDSRGILLEDGHVDILLFIGLIHHSQGLIKEVLIVIQGPLLLLVAIGLFLLDHWPGALKPYKKLLLNLHRSCTTLVLV